MAPIQTRGWTDADELEIRRAGTTFMLATTQEEVNGGVLLPCGCISCASDRHVSMFAAEVVDLLHGPASEG
jgi:hypothetical protein